MNRSKIEKSVRTALKYAQGKTVEEAVEIIMDNLDLVIDLETHPDVLSMMRESPRSSTPPTAVDAVSRATPPALKEIDELVPVIPATETKSGGGDNKTRIYYQIGDLQNLVIASSPTDITVTPEGQPGPIKLTRSIQQLPGSVPGVQLAYIPANADSYTPYAKASFWCSDEEHDVAKAVQKITEDAKKMYKARTSPIMPRPVVQKPIQWSDAGEV